GGYVQWNKRVNEEAIRDHIAREEYRRTHAADIREKMYTRGRPSREHREKYAQQSRKEAAEKELSDLKHAKPTAADEADLADRIERFDQWLAERQAEHAASANPSSSSPKGSEDEV